MSALVRYFHTLRYLKPIQIFGRIAFKLYVPRVSPQVCAKRAASIDAPFQIIDREQSIISLEECRFLNEKLSIVGAKCWSDPSRPKLWTFNLHYFDDLNSTGCEKRRELHLAFIHRWISENPLGFGVGWHPYPTSLRIVNWAKWLWRNQVFEENLEESLYLQARWLIRRLEWHIGGNHLLVNSKALIFVGLYFETAESKLWYRKGLEIWSKEIARQIGRDGGHFELSPMYHSLLLEDWLEIIILLNARNEPIPALWYENVAKAVAWLRAMCHEDNELSFFNDAAVGIARSLDKIEQLGKIAGINLECLASDQPIWHGCESGYVHLKSGAASLIVDVGKIGPDELPAHAHADTLSFEFGLAKQRIFVNSGTSLYELGAERTRQRGTAAHNTVVVDGLDSSEVWGAFRVARRARPKDVQVNNVDGVLFVSATHDGYTRIAPDVFHKRVWKLEENSLEIRDYVSGKFKTAVANFHLHPDVQIRKVSTKLVELIAGDTRIRFACGEDQEVVETDSSYHPKFGLTVQNKLLKTRLRNGFSFVKITWETTE